MCGQEEVAGFGGYGLKDPSQTALQKKADYSVTPVLSWYCSLHHQENYKDFFAVKHPPEKHSLCFPTLPVFQYMRA